MAKSESEVEDEFGYTSCEYPPSTSDPSATLYPPHSPVKLRKRYGALGTIVQYCLPRNTKSGGSMGISLAGHRDRNKMACFIAGINPRGFAAKSDLKVGDEILYGKYSGTELSLEGKDYLIMRESDIYAVLN